MLVIFPNLLILMHHGTFLAVFIWLHLNVNRMYSGFLSLEYLESRTEFYPVCCVLFCFNFSDLFKLLC